MRSIPILIAFTLGACLFSCNNNQSEFPIEDAVVVDFEHSIKGDCSTPFLEVSFYNNASKADAYLWDFGDGTTSNLVSPKKIYPKSGNYTVKLTAYFGADSIQTEKQIFIVRNSDGTGPFGQLSFTRSNASILEITFEITTNEPNYMLIFGDGTSILSNQKMIKHHYAGPGTYSAVLITQNSEGCNCSETTLDLIP